MDERTPCINYRYCQGYAEPGKSKCWCCIEAERNEKASRDERTLSKQEKKPHKPEDVWGWK